MIHRLKIFSL